LESEVEQENRPNAAKPAMAKDRNEMCMNLRFGPQS